MSKVTAPSKIHASKDASNAALKKLGVIQPDYTLFQEKTADGKWETFTEEAEAHVAKLLADAEAAAKAPKTSKAAKEQKKAAKVKTPKAIKEPKPAKEPKHSAASVMKAGIVDGLTKEQILTNLNEAFPEVWTAEKCKKDAWHISWHLMDAKRKGIVDADYKLPK